MSDDFWFVNGTMDQSQSPLDPVTQASLDEAMERIRSLSDVSSEAAPGGGETADNTLNVSEGVETSEVDSYTASETVVHPTGISDMEAASDVLSDDRTTFVAGPESLTSAAALRRERQRVEDDPSQQPMPNSGLYRSLRMRHGVNPSGNETLSNLIETLRVFFGETGDLPLYPDGVPYTPTDYAKRLAGDSVQEAGVFDCAMRELSRDVRPLLLSMVAQEVSQPRSFVF